MVVNLHAIKEILLKQMPDAKVEIIDTVGDGNHFEATIVSDIFLNKNDIQRHKIVYDALGSIVGNELHALSINTKTFTEEGNNPHNTTNTSIKDLYNDTLKKLDEVIHKYDIILFMKGTKLAPMCGFSATVCNILNSLDVQFEDVNVLSSEEIRENIKVYSNWPTIPQLYIKGEFIGGCDIVRNMYSEGTLSDLLKKHNLLG
jgi:monothiol glutaredoxin